MVDQITDGGVGASPPTRGSAPAPRPKLGVYSYTPQFPDFHRSHLDFSGVHVPRERAAICILGNIYWFSER